MRSVMSVMLRISKALDSRNIKEVLLAIQDLDDDFDVSKCQESIVTFLRELITWDLSEDRQNSQLAVSHLISLIKNDDDVRNICKQIICSQPAVAVQIAVEIMIKHNWTLSNEERKEMFAKLHAMGLPDDLEAAKTEEYAGRVGANIRILRVSGTPKRGQIGYLKDNIQFFNCCVLPKEFINELANYIPYHPLLIYEDIIRNQSNVFPMPRVHTNDYILEQQVLEFAEHLQTAYKTEGARRMLTVFNDICNRAIAKLKYDATEIDAMASFFVTALRVFESPEVSIEDVRKTGQNLEKITNRFEVTSRPLFLKHLLRKLNEKKEASINMEPQIVGLIISIFQRAAFKANSPAFYEEFGYFWSLVHQMKYDDVYGATAYFSSVFALAQAQAVFRVKKALCREVYDKILKPMYVQIVDYMKMKDIESEKAKTEAQQALYEQSNVGSEMFSILVCTYKQAEDRILKFINE